MNKFNRPTFGVLNHGDNGVADTTATQDTKSFRPEAGAIWNQVSKNNNAYMNIKLKLSKAKLQELINNTTEDEISIGFVAFPNKSHQGNDRRPAFRVYEEQQKAERDIEETQVTNTTVTGSAE